MEINYENILYPEEAVSKYQRDLLDIYLEDYGEEYIYEISYDADSFIPMCLELYLISLP